jgi:PAS domain S-box-containing protein
MDVHAAEERYRTLFEHSSDGIVIAERETHAIRFVNPAASRMFGYSESALCTMYVSDLSAKDAEGDVLADFEDLAGGKKTVLEGVIRLKRDGSPIIVDISAAPITIDGRAMVAGFFRDVTGRAQTERALKASEEKYRRLFEAARDGVLILDADTGHVVDANPFMTELTGYAREDFLGKFFWEVGPFKDTGASKAALAELSAHGSIRYDDLPLAMRSGGTVDVEFVSNVYLVGERKVIQCNIRDISARKRAEGERLRLAMIIEQADEMVLVTDTSGAIEYVNPAFEKVTGYTRAEALGRNPRFLKSGAQDEAFYRVMWATIHSGNTWRGRLTNKKKDGTRYWQDSTISRVLDPDGKVTGYVAVNRDVTAVLALEAQYLQAQKMEAVGRLAGGVAHDFNNVLSVILSYAEMLLADLKPDNPIRGDVEEIRKAGNRAADLTRQLLMFSRQQVIDPEVIDLNEVLTNIHKMLQRILGADIDLVSLPAQALGRVRADRSSVEQVLMNLVVNARDAMPTGGKLTIETGNVVLDEGFARAHQGVTPGPHVMLVVTDTGTGIDKATLARIFEPFFTTKEKGKGTGLGLSTVFGIVQQSGGNVWVYSEPGHGTTFKIYLPRVDAPVDAVRPPQRPTALRGSETVLLVEDDDQVRAVALGILRKNGYQVIEARDASEALVQAEKHTGTIHLLLSDVVMPQMSGPELAKRLGSARPDMKVLCMSGYADDAIVRHGVLEAHFAFIQKPITPDGLATKVREVLSNG